MNDDSTHLRISHKSLYGRSFAVHFEKYSGIDFSSHCFVFPAQSSAYPGMFRNELAQYEEFRSLFVQADEFAQSHHLVAISSYIRSPHIIPDDQLPLIRTLCLFVAEYSMFRYLQNRGITPSIITGHSFGEYTAITASGMIEFGDMLEIILMREQSCPPPHQLGYLLSISANDDTVSTLLPSQTYEIAVYNSPHQTVIGVQHLDELEALENILKNAQIHFQRLEQVPQPYHTSYIQQCAYRFSQQLSAFPCPVKSPRYPMYSSVLHRRIDPQNFKPELIISTLSNQLVAPMDFISQIKNIHSEGVYGFLEVGPGKVFSQFMSEILQEKPHCIIPLARYVSQDTSVLKEHRVKDYKLLQRICAVISRLTGYELEKIQIRKRLQDDLGIDSIKKAEILFTVLEEEQVTDATSIVSSEIKTVYDLSEEILKAKYAKKLTEHVSCKQPNFQRHRFIWKESKVSRLIARQNLTSKSIIQLSLSKLLNDFESEIHCANEQVRNGENPMIILVFDDEDIGEVIDRSLKFFECMKMFFSRLTGPFHLIAVAYREHLLFCASSSFFKSLKKERNNFQFTSIIAEEKTPISALALENAAEQYHVDLLYRAGRRYAQVMEHEEITISDEERSRFEGSVVVVIGGAKGITYSLVTHLIADYNLTVAIIGRSSLSSSPVAENLEKLKCGKGTVAYYQGDVSLPEELSGILQNICDRYGRIDYVVNGAGYQVSSSFFGRSHEQMQKELASKLTVAQNLLHIGERFNLKKIIWFSSIVAWAGNAGQSVYAFANGGIDYLARTSRVPVLSILWPPWKGLGMMNDAILIKKMDSMGIAMLDEGKAYRLFINDLISSTSTGVVAYHDSASTPMYWRSLTPLKDYQSILGTFMYQRNISFQCDISTESHPFLRDHQLHQSIYLPFSYVVTLLLFHSYFLKGRLGLCKEINLTNPISIGSGAVVAYNYGTVENNQLSVAINSLRHGSQVVFSHGFGIIDYRENPTQHLRDKSSSTFDIYTQSLRNMDSSNIYGTGGLFHGPMYQVLHKLYRDDDGHYVASLLSSMIPQYTGYRSFDVMAAALEASIQLVAVKGLHEHHIFSLPESLRSLYIDDTHSWTGPLFVKTLTVECTKEYIRADTSILSDDGNCVAFLEGVKLRLMELPT